jgi:motility quorum-sensing regulator/GCU-specific mRNA interferase toxin
LKCGHGKKTAHYLLADVKALVGKGSVSATKTALAGAAALGFDFEGMKEENLETSDLYKSMKPVIYTSNCL